jgi:type IX secretion system PorP/SprF family membrane protein
MIATPLRGLMLILLAISGSSQLIAQDPFFSQFYANRVYLNPAYAGLDAGTQITLNYRDQWFGIPDRSGTPFNGGFRTYNLTLNQRLPCFASIDRANVGLAGSFFRDETGLAPLTTTGGSVAFAFEYAILDPNKRTKRGLSRLEGRLGTQIGFLQSSISDNGFIYSYQLDPVVGLLTPPSNLTLATGSYPTMNIGGMLRGSFRHGLHDYTLFSIGASVSNVNQPTISLEDGVDDIRLPIRSTFHMGITTKLTSTRGTKHYNPLFISPQFRWDSQLDGALNLFTLGSYILGRGHYAGVFYQFNSPGGPATNQAVSIGGRNTNALIFSWGIDLRSLMDVGERWRDRETGWIVGFSYDLPVSGLDAGASMGSLEINFRIMLNELKRNKCEILGKNELYKGATCPVSF